MPDIHSTVFSPSSAHRVLKCPPSLMLDKKFPDKGTEFAAEGTYAHAMAEYILRRYISGEPDPECLDGFERSEFYSDAMVDYVHLYTDACMEKIVAARQADAEAVFLPEQRLEFNDVVPGGFGTGDMVIISDKMLEVIDLKYGKGVRVEAEGNPQLQLYALGAIETFGSIYDFDEVKMTIIQPRNGGISEQVMTVAELLEWGESIKPIIAQALKGEGEFQAGEHCRFCKAAPRCKALADYNLSLARLEFKDVDLLTDEEIADVLGRVDQLKNYAEMIAKYALQEAVAGRHQWPGFKLVEGRSRRVYTDQKAIVKALTAAGYKKAQFMKPQKLIGVTDMTKLLTKKTFEELLGDYLEKPQGKPTLAPVSDKRPEFKPAEEFTNLDEENGGM
jgi:hypothetical protein